MAETVLEQTGCVQIPEQTDTTLHGTFIPNEMDVKGQMGETCKINFSVVSSIQHDKGYYATMYAGQNEMNKPEQGNFDSQFTYWKTPARDENIIQRRSKNVQT